MQANVSNLNIVTKVDHPAVNNIVMDLGGAFFVPDIVASSGATVVAFWPECSPNPGTSFVAVKTVGGSKIIGMNLFLYTILGYPGFPGYYNYVCNAIYWAAGNLS